ncbi:MAG: TonB-dependent receptor, partial [Acidobacteria bacterium]|nr:TonB-dependent receptor [Acidobacteriota bacterium]
EGSAFWFHRNDNLDARNFFDAGKPEFKRNQWGATVGGPIIKDKTFFLGSYEGLREGLGRTSVSFVPNANARLGILPASAGGNVTVNPASKRFMDAYYPLPTGEDFGNGTGEFRGVVNQPTDDDFFSGRIDHVLSDNDTLFGRYTFRDGTTIDPFGSSPLPGFPGVGTNRTQFISAEETHLFSPTVLNSFRLAFNRNSRGNPVDPVSPDLAFSLRSNQGLGPLNIGGVSTIGHRISRPSDSKLNVFQVQDAVNFTRGGHSLKVGTDIVRYQSNFDFPLFFNGSYSFNTLRDFLRGSSRNYLGLTADSDAYRGWRWTTMALFLQDEWRIFHNFTLNLGLRYEFYSNPTEVNGKVSSLPDPLKDTQATAGTALFDDNPGSMLWQPRFGFAWDPMSNGKLVVRGGFGVFFDRVHSNNYNGQHTNGPFASTILVLSAPFPNPLAGGTLTTQNNISTTVANSGFSYAYAMQWNFTLQREIVPSTVVSATYAGLRGVHGLIQGDVNQNKSEIRNGRKFFPAGSPPLNPALGTVDLRLSQGNSTFQSLQLNLKRRLTQGLQFQTAYTWSKAIDNGSTFGAVQTGNAPASVPDVFDTKLTRGLADLDVRHNFVFSSSYELPFAKGNRWLGGWQLGGIATLTSGIPFTVRLGFNQARSDRARDISQRPDLVKPVTVDSRNADRYFDVSAFQLQEAGFFGNAGRNITIGPGLVNVDFSVMKTIPITEKVNVQWRFELFNLFNRANFATPADDGGGNRQGPILFSSAAGTPILTAAKILQTASDARKIQMGLKLSF